MGLKSRGNFPALTCFKSCMCPQCRNKRVVMETFSWTAKDTFAVVFWIVLLCLISAMVCYACRGTGWLTWWCGEM